MNEEGHPLMSGLEDKLKGNLDQLKGEGKEGFGKLTGDEATQAEGQVDQVAGGGREALGNLKDAAGNAKDALKDAFDPNKVR